MRVKGVGNMRVNNAVQDEIIRRIDAIDEGAFQPMLEQPVMQALCVSADVILTPLSRSKTDPLGRIWWLLGCRLC